MAVKPDDKGAARLARPGAAFKQYWVLFIGNITAAQPFEYSLQNNSVDWLGQELVFCVVPGQDQPDSQDTDQQVDSSP